MTDLAISSRNLSKRYILNGRANGSLRESISSIFSKNISSQKEFWALKDVSFDLYHGQIVGIVGKNGAGKSTLLKVLSRIVKPTSGSVEIYGRVASLLEVGTGFHGELTGRENIFMNGSILGLKREEIRRRFDEIVDFSGIGEFLDTKIKFYSSGMSVRLGFSVAVHINPEILILDEVLAVGDSIFQQKCLQKMKEIKERGKTILFVSHNISTVRALCNSAIMLKNGSIVHQGSVEDVLAKYIDIPDSKNIGLVNLAGLPRYEGLGDLVLNELRFNKQEIFPADEVEFIINLKINNSKKLYKDVLIGLNIYNNNGECIYHLSNIFLQKIEVNHAENNRYVFRIDQLALQPGKYSVTLFLKTEHTIQDWVREGIYFEVSDGNIYNFNNSSIIRGAVQPKFDFFIRND